MTLYKIGEAAQQLGIHTATLRTWIKSGKIPCSYKTPGNRLLFTEADLEAIRNILQDNGDCQCLKPNL